MADNLFQNIAGHDIIHHKIMWTSELEKVLEHHVSNVSNKWMSIFPHDMESISFNFSFQCLTQKQPLCQVVTRVFVRQGVMLWKYKATCFLTLFWLTFLLTWLGWLDLSLCFNRRRTLLLWIQKGFGWIPFPATLELLWWSILCHISCSCCVAVQHKICGFFFGFSLLFSTVFEQTCLVARDFHERLLDFPTDLHFSSSSPEHVLSPLYPLWLRARDHEDEVEFM